MRRNGRLIVSILVVAFIFAAVDAPASADTGKMLLRGISYALSPTLGQTANGPLADQNIFRQRLIRNFAGDGYGYEFTRTLGTDSYGNANQIEIPGLTAAFQGAIHNRIEVNRRFIPEIRIQSDTQNAPLQYNITSSPGAESFTFNGNIAANMTGTINALGFYSIQVGVSNTGTSRIDGMLLTDQRSTDFDVGPINVTGNIFTDIGSSLLQLAATSITEGANPLATLNNIPSAASAKDKNAAALEITPDMTDAQVQEVLAKSLVQAYFTQALSELNPLEQGNLAELLGVFTEQTLFEYDSSKVNEAGKNSVPEPTTIAFLGLPMLYMLLRKRR